MPFQACHKHAFMHFVDCRVYLFVGCLVFVPVFTFVPAPDHVANTAATTAAAGAASAICI